MEAVESGGHALLLRSARRCDRADLAEAAASASHSLAIAWCAACARTLPDAAPGDAGDRRSNAIARRLREDFSRGWGTPVGRDARGGGNRCFGRRSRSAARDAAV